MFVPETTVSEEVGCACGGETLPGARGGVFTQKITLDERVLAAVLYQRGLLHFFLAAKTHLPNCSRQPANHPSSSPALTQDGYTPTPVAQRPPDAQVNRPGSGGGRC